MLTKQSEKEAADINKIVAAYGKSGVWTNVNPLEPRYQDNTYVTDLLAAHNLIQEANEQFYSLPAEVRSLAENNPIKFAEMLTDEGAVAMLEQLGAPIKKTDPGGEKPPTE